MTKKNNMGIKENTDKKKDIESINKVHAENKDTDKKKDIESINKVHAENKDTDK